MASKPKLKPCPFCGCRPEISVIPNPGGYVASVRCYDSGWMAAGHEVSVFSTTYPSHDEVIAEAISAWDRRAGEEVARGDAR